MIVNSENEKVHKCICTQVEKNLIAANIAVEHLQYEIESRHGISFGNWKNALDDHKHPHDIFDVIYSELKTLKEFLISEEYI